MATVTFPGIKHIIDACDDVSSSSKEVVGMLLDWLFPLWATKRDRDVTFLIDVPRSQWIEFADNLQMAAGFCLPPVPPDGEKGSPPRMAINRVGKSYIDDAITKKHNSEYPCFTLAIFCILNYKSLFPKELLNKYASVKQARLVFEAAILEKMSNTVISLREWERHEMDPFDDEEKLWALVMNAANHANCLRLKLGTKGLKQAATYAILKIILPPNARFDPRMFGGAQTKLVGIIGLVVEIELNQRSTPTAPAMDAASLLPMSPPENFRNRRNSESPAATIEERLIVGCSPEIGQASKPSLNDMSAWSSTVSSIGYHDQSGHQVTGYYYPNVPESDSSLDDWDFDESSIDMLSLAFGQLK